MYEIIQLKPEQFQRCSNIWDINKQNRMADYFYKQLIEGNRITFIYMENHQFIGEASLVFEQDDPQYTIPNQRIYISRMIVKEGHQNRGIGGILLSYLITYAKEKGYKEMSLGVDIDNENARYLYEKYGFNDVLFEGEDEYGKYVKLLKKIN
jgi:diamine N-acetyltransferase